MAHNCENCKFWEKYNFTKYQSMAHFGQSDDFRRDELIRIIEHSVEKLTLAEFLPCKRAELERETLYYDMTTKSYINDN